ncbi:MAG: phosphate ABC transporter permease PstA [Deltaproteobacteria bacterium]|nr:phosphate ABC transporter permease PstA [Deltaproteobacteria bacterium]
MRKSWRQGEHYVWGTAAAVCLTLLIVVVLLLVVMVNGLGFFWPKELVLLRLTDSPPVMGELAGREPGQGDQARYGGDNLRIKVGNRDLYGMDFQWVKGEAVQQVETPPDAVMLERVEFGNFYGFLKGLRLKDIAAPQGKDAWQSFKLARSQAWERKEALLERLDDLMELTQETEDIRLRMARLRHENSRAGIDGETPAGELARLQARSDELTRIFEERNREIVEQTRALESNKAVFADSAGNEAVISLTEIVRAVRPNSMGVFAKTGFYLSKLGELLTGEPRESNTEGGLFPAIFGTVMMVLIMSVFSLPMGVVAAIYLREYAREGLLVRMVRIAVYNLAGVPSIVFGVFGLGFFVYGVGGVIDDVFFQERLPTPTFGTGGILWASLTLALLTIPVVVVATEEGLSAIPRGLREASLALGATKFQTLVRVVIPMAVPGILTGFILAMARAVGEVAPLMITGVVKLAPSLPLDGQFPFIHLERKFMHLGFHIFDVGFQSPNVEAAKPMVYITTLLLIVIVLVLSITAIWLRNSLRKKLQTATF